MKKQYKVKLDFCYGSKFRGAGLVYKFSDADAKKLIASGKIEPYKFKPKRFVILKGKKITWGQYLKYKHKQKL